MNLRSSTFSANYRAGSRAIRRNLMSPKYRTRTVAMKTKQSDRQVTRAKLKQGKYDHRYDLPTLFNS